MAPLLRPAPVPSTPELARIDGNAQYRQVEEWLTQGRPVCITDTYGTALTLYAWLKRSLRRRRPVVDYRTHRLYRELLWQLTRPLLVPIEAHQVALKKSPHIPWLEVLYPDQADFLLPLPELLGLNGAWQWYARGVRYPVLQEPLHPFYGVHFTTRSEHLELFHAYLAAREAVPEAAVDVGAGAGPLTMLLLQRGVLRVEAADANPNALHGLREDLERQQLTDRVQLCHADLVPPGAPAELMAFNPPWLPGEHHAAVDSGTFYGPDLFPRFFAAAAARLAPTGRLVMLFSNLAQVTELATAHPIQTELQEGGRFRLLTHQERPVAAGGGPKIAAWQRDLRARERVELWELAHR